MKKYNRHLSFLRHQCKSSGLSARDVFKTIEKAFLVNPRIEYYSGFAGCYAEMLFLEGKATSLFMPNRAFCDWLVSCVPRLEPSHAAVVAAISNSECVCILFPTESKLSSFCAYIPSNIVSPDGVTEKAGNLLILSFSAGNNENLGNYTVPLNDTRVFKEHELYYIKLIVGLGMYLACFPGCSVSGIPEGLAHPNWFPRENRVTIQVADEIFATRGTHAPHYRMGHFRMLSSDKFTKKRGQVIFINGCFVNGAASTVLSPEEQSA